MTSTNGFKGLSISAKLLLAFLLIGLLPAILIGVLIYGSAVKTTKQEVVSRVETIADTKLDQLQEYIFRNEKRIIELAHLPLMADAVIELSKAFSQGGVAARKSEINKKLGDRLINYLDHLRDAYGYYDLFFISPAGQILFSLHKEADWGTNLKTGAFKESNLARAFSQSSSLLQIQISEFSYYAPSKEWAAFICTPLIKGRKIVGYLAVQISIKEIHNIAADYSGLGKTGETVIAAQEKENALIIAPLRHRPQAAFTLKLPLNDRLQIPMLRALKGDEDFGESVDYRKEKILASWRYIPAFRWGVVVKIDANEAFAPVAHLRNRLLLVLLITLIVVIILSRVISNTFSIPIKTLTQMVSSVAAGDYSKRAVISSRDEIGLLAETLNTTVSAIERNNWIKTGQNGLAQKMRGDKTKADLYQDLLTFLGLYLEAIAGTFYVRINDDLFSLGATIALAGNRNVKQLFKTGEGLVGEAVQKREKILVSDLPVNFPAVEFSSGEIALQHILIFPIVLHDRVMGVVELGRLDPFTNNQIDFMEIVSESIAYAVQSNS
jgi:two-component system, NtrC family, sensor kinase